MKRKRKIIALTLDTERVAKKKKKSAKREKEQNRSDRMCFFGGLICNFKILFNFHFLFTATYLLQWLSWGLRKLFAKNN